MNEWMLLGDSVWNWRDNPFIFIYWYQNIKSMHIPCVHYMYGNTIYTWAYCIRHSDVGSNCPIGILIVVLISNIVLRMKVNCTVTWHSVQYNGWRSYRTARWLLWSMRNWLILNTLFVSYFNDLLWQTVSYMYLHTSMDTADISTHS